MIKELLISLEYTNTEIKGMACEYYNTRYNVLAFDSIICDGIDNYQIVDKDLVKEQTLKLISNLENKLNGAKIRKVLLVIPPVNYSRKSFVSEIITDQGYITNKDVDRGIRKILNTDIDEDLFIVNAYITKYEVNGITSRIIPIETACQNFKINTELLLADKKLVFEYVTLLSEINIDVLDISLSTYGLVREAVLLEKSIQKNILIFELNNQNSSIAYLKNDKIMSIEILDYSLNKLVQPLVDKYDIPYNVAIRFFKYCLCQDDNYYDDAIYAWNKNEINYSISKRILYETCKPAIDEFINDFKSLIQPITEYGETVLYVTSEGADAQGLIDILKNEINIEIEAYYPMAPGARNGKYSNLYGSFYAHKELFDLRNKKESCVDLQILNDSLTLKNPENKEDEDTITTKIKKFFTEIR